MIRVKHGEDWLYVTDIDIDPKAGKATLNVNSNHSVEVELSTLFGRILIDGKSVWPPMSEPTGDQPPQ